MSLIKLLTKKPGNLKEFFEMVKKPEEVYTKMILFKVPSSEKLNGKKLFDSYNGFVELNYEKINFNYKLPLFKRGFSFKTDLWVRDKLEEDIYLEAKKYGIIVKSR